MSASSSSSSSPVEIYIDKSSQPSRAIHHLVLLLGLPDPRIRVVRITSGDHKQPEYMNELHPLGKVPAFQHGSVSLWESHAIMVYLAQLPGVKHSQCTTRAALAGWFQRAVLFAGKASPSSVGNALNSVNQQMQFFESYWLKTGPFINGFKKPTIADLSAWQEFVQVSPFLPVNWSGPFPKLQKWLNAMEQLPYAQDVNSFYLTKTVPALRAKIPAKL